MTGHFDRGGSGWLVFVRKISSIEHWLQMRTVSSTRDGSPSNWPRWALLGTPCRQRGQVSSAVVMSAMLPAAPRLRAQVMLPAHAGVADDAQIKPSAVRLCR